MAVNLHEKYGKQVAERFYLESVTQSCFSKSMDVEFTGVKTVKVTEILTAPMNNYTRSGTARYGTPADLQDLVHEYTMTQDRSFTFVIDKGDNSEQQMIKNAGKAISRQLREVVTPEIDTYRLAQWAAGARNSATVTAPTGDTIYGMIVDAMLAMDNAKVPKNGRTLFVGSVAYKALLTSPEFLQLEKTGNKALTAGEVGRVLGMSVKYVPDSYLPSKVVFMVVMKDAAISPVKMHEYKIHTDPPGISGHLAEGRFIYDAFVKSTANKSGTKDGKTDGVYVAKTGS